MRYLILSLIILLGLSSHAMSGTRDPSTPDSKHLEYGKKHECVVQVKGQMEFEEKEGKKIEVTASGSGVIIAKRYVLTAAHVVQKTKDPYIILNGKKIAKNTASRCHFLNSASVLICNRQAVPLQRLGSREAST